MKRPVLGFAVLFAVLGFDRAARSESVDLELVLLADASRSIDQAEIQFQRQGYATAINDPAVLSAISQGFDQKIAVTYVEWGSADSQDVVVPWTIIDGPNAAASFAEALLAAPRKAFGPNAIGSAIDAAQRLIETNAYNGYRKVIDFSGDSAYSGGGVPVQLARANALAAEIVINGLAILCRAEACSGRPSGYDLEEAYAQLIIGGPGSFVVTAERDDQFAEAVRRKLLLEIASHPGSQPARRELQTSTNRCRLIAGSDRNP